jgi:zinc protease
MVRLVSSLLAATLLSALEIDLDRIRIPHRKFVLSNGLTLLVHEDHSAPVVGVNLWYHVGSRNETRGKTGFAHLFEHFFFNGSENYPHGFREAMDDLGATNRNGTTSPDRTNFFEDVPTSALDRTLYLEADRMGFLAKQITAASLTRERGVVQNEKRQGENQPYGRVFGSILQRLYPYAHPYSWSTIGEMADLEAASLKDVQEWYATYYGPNNCVLSLAGDVTPEQALALVKKYFGSIPPGPPLPRLETWIPRLERSVRETMEDRVAQPRIYRIYHAPAWADRETQHLALAARALSGTRAARLDRRLIYDRKLATAISASTRERESAGLFLITVTLAPRVDAAAAERELDAVLDEFLKTGPTAAELQRARAAEYSGFLRGIERLGGFGGRSDVLAQSMTYGGSPEVYVDRFRALASVPAEEVAAVSRKWLGTPHFTLTVLPIPAFAPEKSEVDRKILPPLGPAPDVPFPRVQTSRLANGLRVYLIERHTLPLVNLALAATGGSSADPSGKSGLASLAVNLMTEGTASRDSFRIAEELEALGASVTGASSVDATTLRLRALKGQLAPSLEVFADIALHPSFTPAMLELARGRRLAQIRQEQTSPVPMALRLVPKLIYGEGHPYAGPFTGSGSEASLRGLTREDLLAWHQTWFRPGSSALVVAGDVTMAELTAGLDRAFASWPAGEAPKREIAPPAKRGAHGKVYLVDKPDAPQSIIAAAHVTEAGGQPDEQAIATVMRLFGGMSTSRLNRNLRLDKHWSYGTTGMIAEARGPRPLMVIAPVQTDKTKEAMVEVAKEIRGIAGERPIAGEEFESIKRTVVLSLPGRFATLAALEQALLEIATNGVAPGYFYNYAARARELSADQLNKAGARYVQPSELTWLVVGDVAKIEQGVRELGLGEVVRIDK